MKYLSIFFLILGTNVVLFSQQTYVGGNSEVTFYSYAPLEDIEATNKKVSAALNTKTGEIVVKMYMTDFHFDKSLMEEHFNENYIESDKYPTAIYQGTVATDSDITSDGTYEGRTSGSITIHGVTKPVEADVVIVKTGSLLKATTKFQVKTADHKIKVPRIVIKNIAEVIDISVDLTLAASEN